MDRGEGSSPVRPKRFGRIDPFCWIPVVSLVTIAALMVVSGAAPFGAALVVFALLLLLFDSWVNRPDPRAEQRRPARPPARPLAADQPRVRENMRPREENRPRPPYPERPRNVPPPPPMRNRPMPPRQQPPRMDPRAMPRQPPPPPPRRPGPRSGAGA